MTHTLSFLCLAAVFSIAHEAKPLDPGDRTLVRPELIDFATGGSSVGLPLVTFPSGTFSSAVTDFENDLRNGDFDRIARFAPLLLRSAPESPELHAYYSIFLAASGQIGKSREHLNSAKSARLSSVLMLSAEALLALAEGDDSTATQLCQKAIQMDPPHPYPWNILGKAHWKRKEAAEAIAAFRKCVQINPRFLAGYLNWGAISVVEGNRAEAVHAYQLALQQFPSDHITAYRLALLHAEGGAIADAVRLIQGIPEAAPIYDTAAPALARIYLEAGRAEECIRLAEKLVERGTKGSAAFLADACIQTGDLRKARAVLRDVDPDAVDGVYIEGLLSAVEGNFPEALRQLRAARLLDPAHYGALVGFLALTVATGLELPALEQNPPDLTPELLRLIHFFRGARAGAKGEFTHAFDAFQRAEGFIPGFSMAGLDKAALAGTASNQFRVLPLGVLLDLKGYTDAAASVFQKAVREKNDSALVRYFAGVTHLKRNEIDKALADFEACVQISPRFYSALVAGGELRMRRGDMGAVSLFEAANRVKANAGISLRLGVMHEKAKNFQKAEAEYRKFIAMQPDYFVGYNQLAWLLVESEQKLEEALKLARRANELQSGNASILDTLGWIYYHRRQYGEAVKVLKEASAISPGNPTIWYHLGAAYQGIDDTRSARTALHKSLELAASGETADRAQTLLKKLPRS